MLGYGAEARDGSGGSKLKNFHNIMMYSNTD
jgi:hypothetical protein